MRFSAEGPNIPNELLIQQEQGEVVFFCGAGISIPAGLPSFFDLTKKTIQKLGAHPSAKIMTQMRAALAADDPELAPPLDQVFGMIQREYTSEKVEKEVTQLLRSKRTIDASKHKTVLRLSKDVDGNPFVITTNFDLLFEQAQKGLTRWVPPMLPDIMVDQPPTGIVYLHGRLRSAADRQRKSSALILGSSDFGRAYLADGWATNFIRKLLEQRVVVLLGYSAGDPPIRYLLEGLNASTSAKLRTIYAFDRGDERTVRAKWRDLGVQGIPFDSFDDLWGTLELWATRSDDPGLWTTDLLKLAQKSPRDLMAFQRGQIASLVSNRKGAKAFATTDPAPSAEWLCVFDKFARYGEPSEEGWDDKKEQVDPLVEYGLDHDPPRPDPSNNRAQIEGIDLLGSLPEDSGGSAYTRLSGFNLPQSTPFPRRLQFLSHWFERVAHEPAAIWWATRQRQLHPELMTGVNRRLEGHGVNFEAGPLRSWSLLAEIQKSIGIDVHDNAWFGFTRRLVREGWTPTILRLFEGVVWPRLNLSRYARRTATPPNAEFVTDVTDLVRLEVQYTSRHGADIETPDEILPDVFRIVRASLEHASGLLAETGDRSRFFHLPAINPDERPGRPFVRNEGIEGTFSWAVSLFDRLCAVHPDHAKKEAKQWPEQEKYIFDKLRIFSWTKRELFSGAEVSDGVLSLRNESFWNIHLQRELLHLLRDRWRDFSASEAFEIEQLVRRGREPSEHESTEDFQSRNTSLIAERLGWLEQNGCRLSEDAVAVLEAKRASPNWNPAWETNADRDFDGRGGSIERREDANELLDLSLADIIPTAERRSGRFLEDFVEYAPFAGLVSERPARAIAALSFEKRHGRFPTAFWRDLLHGWPENTSLRLLELCSRRVSKLPTSIQFDLRYDIASWVKTHLAKRVAPMSPLFLDVWDRLFSELDASGAKATESGLGEITVGGHVVEKSRKTIDHAINAPVGVLVEALLDNLAQVELKSGSKFPETLTLRLERTLKAVGEGADHAATLLGSRLAWLYEIDPKWVKRTVLPIFKISSPSAEAAWNGILFGGRVPQNTELFNSLKGDFLSLFESRTDWLVEERLGRDAAKFLMIATYWNKYSKRYVANAQCRRALQELDDAGRQAALWTLKEIIEQDSWKSYGRRFFSEVWPQEAQFQTSATTETMLRIAEDDPDKFPEIVEAMDDFLRPVEYPDLFLYKQARQTAESERETLAKRWPMQVLQVLDRIIEIEPRNVPHDLSSVLDDIAESAPRARYTRAWKRLHELLSR
ncbi:SIR2 family protein [Phyllobacterium zundukense]|uniref:Uncharacterized protein n=1 Tax=Phyllobacterium zundukense TaxID=1867719 RepID=A0A2N9W065_9HYPH|nr:SIR2 family protein [Phyllobacterium zundukense]ATU90628.1 hypothetical protein BLM14_02360 [Phyllobacterium zundukense]PIO45133.1 hypothetical protein B5P45_08800 [Phyllobacterium zundukense]